MSFDIFGHLVRGRSMPGSQLLRDAKRILRGAIILSKRWKAKNRQIRKRCSHGVAESLACNGGRHSKGALAKNGGNHHLCGLVHFLEPFVGGGIVASDVSTMPGFRGSCKALFFLQEPCQSYLE